MRAALAEVMREFDELGIPEDVRARDVAYSEKEHSATVASGIRRTGKTYVRTFRNRLSLRGRLVRCGIR